jgi:hypothetical protein
MTRENRQLVTYEPVEFEFVENCKKFTDHFRGIYRIHPNLIKKNRRMSTCNHRLDMQINTRISTDYAQKSLLSLIPSSIEVMAPDRFWMGC